MRKWIFIGLLLLCGHLVADDYMEWNWPVTDAPPEYPGGQNGSGRGGQNFPGFPGQDGGYPSDDKY